MQNLWLVNEQRIEERGIAKVHGILPSTIDAKSSIQLSHSEMKQVHCNLERNGNKFSYPAFISSRIEHG
jgi:hypothetical protein